MIVFLPIAVFVLVFFPSLILARKFKAIPLLTEPRCAKCNYDLRGFSGTVPTRCSECGADLSVRHAIVWGTYQPHPKRIWLSLIGLLPLLVIPAISLLHSRSMPVYPGSPGFSSRSNAVVIAALATTANTPWDWQELERRLAAGKLSKTEVGQAVDSLIAFLKSQTTSQPLNWADNFITKADAAGMITDEQYLRLAQAFYQPVKVSIAGKIRSGAKLPIVVTTEGAWQLPGMECVYALRQVAMGSGQTVKVISDQDDRSAGNDDYLSANRRRWSIDGHTRLDLPPGNYTLTFTVDTAVLLDKTSPQIVDILPGQATHWPKARAAWSQAVTVPIMVVAADQSPIAVVSDPALEPKTGGAVRVKSIRVISKGSGARVTASVFLQGTKVACSFDVILRLGGKEYPAGSQVAALFSSSTFDHACDLPSLDRSVVTADVLLRPNPKHAEGTPGIDSVWGGPIDVLNVPLQRYDLPGN